MAALLLASMASAASAEKLFTELGGAKAYLPDDFACAAKARITVRADDPAYFNSDRANLEKMIAGVRAVLGFQCDQIEDVMIRGVAGDKTVYGGVVTAKNDWLLIDVPVSIVDGAPAQTIPPPASETPKNAGSVTALALPPKPDQNAGGAKPFAAEPPPAPPPATKPEASGGIEQFKDVQRNIQGGSFPDAGYNFAPLIASLYLGKLSDIPDDQESRKTVGSIIASVAENCGDRPINVARAFIAYIDPKLGRAMSGDRDALMQEGLGRLAEMLKGMSQGMPGMMDYIESNAWQIAEAKADGRLFIQNYGCQGADFGKFERSLHSIILQRSGSNFDPYDVIAYSRLMSPALRNRLGYADPDEALREREMAGFHQAAQKSCEGRFDQSGFCACAVDKLKDASLTKDQWQTIGGEFANVTRYGALRPAIAACY
ncbi:hypothetical protein [Mesorhizobium australicum]|nr:hypothetical protein [Mesorhizobium australicum]